MRVYDGESLRDVDPRARSVLEYREAAGIDEGMNGLSTRFAFKVLAATFNHDTVEIAADLFISCMCSNRRFGANSFPPKPRSATWSL